MKLEFYKQIFEKYSNVKFCENYSIGSPVVSGRQAGGLANKQAGRLAGWQAGRLAGWQAGRHGEANTHFSKFCERA
jgi:hypothetical protein